jgi:hypothetical protein
MIKGFGFKSMKRKAGLLWSAFRNRMGYTSSPNMIFDLSSMFTALDGLDLLVNPFQAKEIGAIVKQMRVDKAPGPDGFNGLFMKKCWQIVKGDFHALCSAFFHGQANLESINTSFITLVPKKIA